MIDPVIILRARLLADAGLAAKVAGRIHLTYAPASTSFPDIVMFSISQVRKSSLAGAIYPATERVQFQCRGTSLSSASGVAQEVDRALGNASFTDQGVIFDSIVFAGKAPAFDDSTTVFRAVVDYYVNYRPA